LLTRKHFRLLAEILYETKDEPWYVVVHHFATRLKETNPRFNADEFIEACYREESEV